MTKADQTDKHQRRLDAYREAGTHLDRLLEAYAIGERDVTTEHIAGEIVGRYRLILTDKRLVNYDGPLARDIERALQAARLAGFRAGVASKKGTHIDR